MKMDVLAAKLADYRVVLEPDENTPDWWAGAPSVVHAEDGTFFLAARMREGNSPKGQRGYETRILKSVDGGHTFEVCNRITREAAAVPGFERPAILQDPKTGAFKLYSCAGLDCGWAILKFDDADDPANFDPRSCRPVLVAPESDDEFARLQGFKDPVIFRDDDRWRMFVIGLDRVERIYAFESGDGETWQPFLEAPVMENAGWHNFYTRPASVIPMDMGYLFVYEGSHIAWHDPVYNIATGLAYSPDLEEFIDLTPDEPLLKSSTPGDCHTWRYSQWLRVGDKLHVYFEAARPNNTNEIRLSVIDLSLGL